MDREEILNKINQIRTAVGGDLPNVYLLHGELDDKDINDLYNHGKIKAMINITKGEGFGRPLLEFTRSKKPIIVSGWSGHLDFLNPEFNCLVSGELKPIHGSAVVPNMILPESQWFNADIPQVTRYLKDVFENYEKYQELSKRQSHISKTKFSFEEMKNVLNTYLDIIPKPIAIKLPQLKKIK
jgi:glycosyltransferase involved in cell wall biosynthesis